MANDFEKAYEQYKFEKNASNDENIDKNSLPKWVGIIFIILAAGFSGAATKILAREYGVLPGMMIILFTIVGILGVVYFFNYAKKNRLASKIKNYTKSPSPDELLKWHELKEKGAITEEEFEVHKNRILG